MQPLNRCKEHVLLLTEHCDHMEEMLKQIPGQFLEGEGDSPKDAVERLKDAYEQAIEEAEELEGACNLLRKRVAELEAALTRIADDATVALDLPEVVTPP